MSPVPDPLPRALTPERLEFEAWVRSEELGGGDLERSTYAADAEYQNPWVQFAWNIWKASRKSQGTA